MEKKRIKVGVIVVAVLLSNGATKEQKQIKLQLCNKQCSIVGSCYSKKMKFDEEKKRFEKFSFPFFFSTSASHSHDIEPFHLYICLLPKKFSLRS